MTGPRKKKVTARKITPRVKRPLLNDEERRQNDRHRASINYIKMRQKGYRAYNVFLPDGARKDIQKVIRKMINDYEKECKNKLLKKDV